MDIAADLALPAIGHMRILYGLNKNDCYEEENSVCSAVHIAQQR
jgi:hypothetical protein